MTIRPRRSVLYMPGSNARAHREGEDAAGRRRDPRPGGRSAPDAKAAAREQVAAAVKAGGFGKREVFIRVNGFDTPWFSDDMTPPRPASPDAILVPKSRPHRSSGSAQRLIDMHATLQPTSGR